MKIIFFTEVYLPTINGVVTSINSFTDELVRRGHEVYIFAPSNPMLKTDPSNIYRVSATSLGVNKDYFWSHPDKNTFSLLKSLKPDIIHTHHQFGMGWFALKSAKTLKIPIIDTYHTLLPDYVHHVPLFGKIEPFKSLLIGLLNHQTIKFGRQVDALISPSHALAIWLKKIGVTRQIDVVSTGINLADYENNTRGYITKKHSFNSSKIIILFAGRLAQEKNVSLLINSFAKVYEKNSNIQLLLVGSGPQEDDYRKLINDLNITNAVTMTGFIKPQEAKKYFSGVDIFAFPSVTDTQGIVVAQALAGKSAVIACNRLGPKDIIKDGGNGLLVEPNLADFSAGLEKLVCSENLRHKLSNNAQKMLNSLTVEYQTDKLITIYKRFINVNKIKQPDYVASTSDNVICCDVALRGQPQLNNNPSF